METTLKLGFIDARPQPIKTPFWFTSVIGIHLSGENDNITIDLDKQTKHTIFEIIAGVQKGLITSTVSLEQLNEYLTDKQTDDDQALIASQEPKDSAEVKNNILVNEASKLLALSNTELKKAIGTDKINADNTLDPGITDVKLLETMIQIEKDNKNRQAVIGALTKRLTAIKEVGISITSEQLEIEEEEYKKVKYNEKTQTLDEVTETTEV